MQSGNSPKKSSIHNKSVIKTLIMLRNTNGSIFNTIPQDITKYTIEILKNLPNPPNIFDTLTSGIIAVCNDYKTDFLFTKNKHHDLACEVEELIKLLIIEKDSDEKQAFFLLNVYIIGLIEVLAHYKKSTKFLNKLRDLLDSSNYLIIYELCCDNASWQRNDKIRLTDRIKFCNEFMSVHTQGTPVTLSTLLTTLFYVIDEKCLSNGYLNNYLLNNIPTHFTAFDSKIRADILKMLKEKYTLLYNPPKYQYWIDKNPVPLNEINKEIEFLLDQSQSKPSIQFSRK